MKEFNRLKQCLHGLMLFNENDQYIGRSLELYGEYSQGEVAIFDQIIREGMVVLDVGANIGAHTLFFAKKVGLAGTVHAFEPQRIVYQTLCANMALNHVVNAHCHNVALGGENGRITVPIFSPWGKDFNFGGVSLGRYEAGESVPLLLLDELEIPGCHFIKIDVEGMEVEVLRGARNLIQRRRPVIYMENDRQEKSAELINHLDGLGYTLYWHRPLLYNPENFVGNPENIFGNIGSHNMLCLPKELTWHLDGFEKVKLPG